MKLKKLAVSILSAGLIMSLGTEAVMAKAETEKRDGETKAQVNFTGGHLALNEATGNIQFSDIEINSGKTEKYESFSDKDIGLKVTDSRGNGKGWKISAELKPFSKDYQETLRGSTIILPKGTASQASEHDEKDNPTMQETVELGGIDAVPVAIAYGNDNFNEAAGRGVWDITFDKSGIKLNVPGVSAEGGEHKAVINWTLTDDMTNEGQ